MLGACVPQALLLVARLDAWVCLHVQERGAHVRKSGVLKLMNLMDGIDAARAAATAANATLAEWEATAAVNRGHVAELEELLAQVERTWLWLCGCVAVAVALWLRGFVALWLCGGGGGCVAVAVAVAMAVWLLL